MIIDYFTHFELLIILHFNYFIIMKNPFNFLLLLLILHAVCDLLYVCEIVVVFSLIYLLRFILFKMSYNSI